MYSYVGPSFISSLFYFIYFTSVLHFNSFLHFYVGPSFIGKAEHNAPVPKEKKKVESDVFRKLVMKFVLWYFNLFQSC